jgi:predicted nucleic acid-binding protein
MAATNAEPAFVDTNVLLDATDRARPRHLAALKILERRRKLVFSAQIVREYLVVATRPVESNGLGLGLDHALENVAEFRRAIRLLPEEKPLLPALLDLLRAARVSGKAIHDALVIATMRVHRVRELLTSNHADFARFASGVKLTEIGPA